MLLLTVGLPTNMADISIRISVHITHGVRTIGILRYDPYGHQVFTDVDWDLMKSLQHEQPMAFLGLVTPRDDIDGGLDTRYFRFICNTEDKQVRSEQMFGHGARWHALILKQDIENLLRKTNVLFTKPIFCLEENQYFA